MQSQGRLVAVLLFSLFFAGCGKNRASWNSFPVAIYADSTITSSTHLMSDFQDAMGFWESKAGKKLFDFKGTWSGQNPPYSGTADNPSNLLGNVIFYQNPWPFASNVAGRTTVFKNDQDIQAAIIMINPDLSYCSSTCLNAVNQTSSRRDFAHELGHFIGLDHTQDSNNIMYPELQPGGALDGMAIDQNTLDQVTNP